MYDLCVVEHSIACHYQVHRAVLQSCKPYFLWNHETFEQKIYACVDGRSLTHNYDFTFSISRILQNRAFYGVLCGLMLNPTTIRFKFRLIFDNFYFL